MKAASIRGVWSFLCFAPTLFSLFLKKIAENSCFGSHFITVPERPGLILMFCKVEFTSTKVEDTWAVSVASCQHQPLTAPGQLQLPGMPFSSSLPCKYLYACLLALVLPFLWRDQPPPAPAQNCYILDV